MTAPRLSFGESDDDQRIEEFNAAARNVFDANLTTGVELFGKLEEQGFAVPNGLNNIPAILLARLSPMIRLALQLADIQPEDNMRDTIHQLVQQMLAEPGAYEISSTPRTQTSILLKVKSELDLRSAAIGVEATVGEEYGTKAGEIILPPVVGNEPLLNALREAAPDTKEIERVVIITIRHIVLEGRLSFYEIVRMSR
jgi:hypothetical protein